MNWFVGLEVPAFEGYRQLMARLPDGLLPFDPQDLHLTVAFLGNCGQQTALNAWEKVIDEVNFTPFSITLRKVLPFGSRFSPSAYSAVPELGKEAASNIIARYRDVFLREAQVGLDPRPPRPHITLARPHRGTRSEQRSQHNAWALQLNLNNVRIPLETIVLYTWADDRTDRQFKKVAWKQME
ncbi:MAG: hypothetical protein J0L94_15235 [Rhodothermia bacterium]|nr:hypothetical protein [Rhodothermia bacterium]